MPASRHVAHKTLTGIVIHNGRDWLYSSARIISAQISATVTANVTREESGLKRITLFNKVDRQRIGAFTGP
ncbi:hypothetical protein A235_01059 [Pseudomonas syringae pv. actinidiae ICMP 19079]|nr:hypothetical protein A235_01059 [Pseudomonas syringae pv. actinidiae ICMP 19079]GAO91254.1 hypothetical protein PSA5_01075 [Pseudomonas syringae pv. actinidiae]